MKILKFQGSAATAAPHRPSMISEVGSIGKNSMGNNLSSHGPETERAKF